MDSIGNYILEGLAWGYLLLGMGWMLSLILLPLVSLVRGAEDPEKKERRVNINTKTCWGRCTIVGAFVNRSPHPR